MKETGTAYGHVLDGEIRHVDLTYVDQNTPVVVYDKDWQNNRQRVEVNVLKKEKDSDRTDRKSTRLNSSHRSLSRMPSSA